MSRRRIIAVHVLLGLILTGSAYAVISQRETWPFSPYPMYSWIEKNRSIKRLQLYGVPVAEDAPEFELQAFSHLQPLDDARLYVALRRLQRRPHSKQNLQASLKDLLERYEGLRRDGKHDGPPLRGIRLYQLLWLDIDPRHFEEQTADHRRLISEVQQKEAS